MSEPTALPPDAVAELETAAARPRADRRRRAISWPTAALVLALVGVLGFLVGVRVQKRHSTTDSTAVTSSAGRNAATTAGGGAFGGGATIGDVKVIDGSVLYVTDRDGNTVRVSTTPSSRFSKVVDGSVQDIRPGDTIVVQGTKSADGSVEASSVTIGTGAFGGRGGGRRGA